VHGGQLGHPRLEQSARLEHAGDLAEADLLTAAQQLARHQLGGDEDAARLAAAHLKHARLGQGLDRLAQGRPADPHLRRQVALGRQAVARVQVAALDLLGDLLHGFLEGAASRDRLKRAHCRGDHRSATARLATSTRSSACRSATSTGVPPSVAAVAIASSSLSIACSMRARSTSGPPPDHSQATWISPPQLARKSGT
jgi:hypothetical protein